MKVIDKATGKDVTRDVINASYVRMGYAYKVIMGEGHKVYLKAEHWDRAMAYAEEGYQVIEL